MSKLSKVLEINTEDIDVVVQPGTISEALDEELRATGLSFPVDLGANDSIGGMAEHGDLWEVMGTIKDALDPRGILNSGKMVFRTASEHGRPRAPRP